MYPPAPNPFFQKEDILEDVEVKTVREIADIASKSYRKIRRQSIENRVLSNYGLDLDNFTNKQDNFKDKFLEKVLREISKVEEEFKEYVQLLVVGTNSQGGC